MISAMFYVLLGLVAGALSGLVGIGGGVLIVPALIFLFGLGQHQAQGTTLALLVPPIGLLAAWTYYRMVTWISGSPLSSRPGSFWEGFSEAGSPWACRMPFSGGSSGLPCSSSRSK
jgi:hypothetical protein